jgi:hypothetical protein
MPAFTSFVLGGLLAAQTYNTISSARNASEQLKAQRQALADQQAQSNAAIAEAKSQTDSIKKQSAAAVESYNSSNKKRSDIGSVLAAASADAKGGVQSTMITSPSGIDLTQLSGALDKKTILGG